MKKYTNKIKGMGKLLLIWMPKRVVKVMYIALIAIFYCVIINKNVSVVNDTHTYIEENFEKEIVKFSDVKTVIEHSEEALGDTYEVIKVTIGNDDCYKVYRGTKKVDKDSIIKEIGQKKEEGSLFRVKKIKNKLGRIVGVHYIEEGEE